MRYDVRTLAVIAAITVAGPVFAGTAPSTATLAAPARVASITAESGVWRCDGTTCGGLASTTLREAVAVCTGLADSAGRVVAFTAAGKDFTADDLARCNRHQKSQ